MSLSIIKNGTNISKHDQSKAYIALRENKDKHVILYSDSDVDKFYLLSYFFYLNRFTFCVIYDKLSVVQDFKKQLSHFFPNIDYIKFVYKNKWVEFNFTDYRYVISPFKINLHINCNTINIIYSDNIKYDNIKVIEIKK